MEEHGSAGPADGEGRAHAQERSTPGTYLTPYPPEQEADHRSRAVTAALLATALVVALGAGGAVYGVLADEGPAVTPTAPSASP
ncbi:hypothetical protein ACIRP7_44115 [Streptomyces sp. NPDC102270]|uniref:hypothetical protein n=1 Tax=Streptomyces sp. NPDC102270 TaxID=3366150 RepID=UPI003810E3E6